MFLLTEGDEISNRIGTSWSEDLVESDKSDQLSYKRNHTCTYPAELHVELVEIILSSVPISYSRTLKIIDLNN